MTPTAASGVDFRAIRQLYATDATARTILDEFASFRHNRTTTALEQLLFRLTNAGKPVPKSEAIDVLRKLDDFGCGDFITGRKGHPTRFAWRYPMSEIGKAAAAADPKTPEEIKPLHPLEATDADIEDDAPEAAAEVPATPEAIVHSYQLRPDQKVEFRLPADLTEREARRLSEFLKTLPFEAADS
jgi:hypothetical protein